MARALGDVADADPVVFGIPRGGVVVAAEIASALHCPLDVVVVRKLGYPGHEEAGFGALGEGGVLVPDELATIPARADSAVMVRAAVERQRAEVAERVRLYRTGRERVGAYGRTAIVVDDGIATGFTFAAGLAIVAKDRPRRLIGAAPVASADGAALARGHCDEVRTLKTPDPGRFFAVSLHYRHFEQVDDGVVVDLLEAADRRAEENP